jgi:hypothetical protein
MCTAGKAFAGAAIANDVSTSRSTLAVRIIDLVRGECPSVMTTTGRRNMHILDRTGIAWDSFVENGALVETSVDPAATIPREQKILEAVGDVSTLIIGDD